MYIPHFVRSKSQRKKLPYKRGIGQKMTKADEGGRGGHPNADNCWRGGEGGSAKSWPLLTRGGGGVSRMLTIADKGGGGQKNFKKRRLWVLRMWIKRTIDSNLTVYVKQSHKTCKLDPNKWISPILSCQKAYVENCSTIGPAGKCWRRLTRGEGG